MTRRYDPRRAQPHLSYSRKDLCETFKVGLPTISAWTKKGLQPIDKHRPYLYAGTVVREFLENHNKPRQPTGPGEIFCVACKRVVEPAGGVMDFIRLTPTNGNLVATCPFCSRRICQRVRITNIARKAGDLAVRYEDGWVTSPVCAGPLDTVPHGEGAA